MILEHVYLNVIIIKVILCLRINIHLPKWSHATARTWNIKFGSQNTAFEIPFCLDENKEHLQFTVKYIVENYFAFEI
jgi:hypothetical protein